MVVCKNCGKENQPHYKFCLYCGSEILGDVDREAPEVPRLMDREAPEVPRLMDREAPEAPRLIDEQQATLPEAEAVPRRAASGDPDNPDTPLPPPRPPSVYFTGEPRGPFSPETGASGLITEPGPTIGPTKVSTQAMASGTNTTRPPAGGLDRILGKPADPATTLRPESPSRVCPTCKALVPIGFQFCGQCGGRVDVPRRAGTASSPSSGRLLLIRPDGSEGGWHPLLPGVNLVGRGSGPLFDADSYLSPLHLQVELLDNGLFTLRDAGSLNGVFVKLTEEEAISDGAVFRLGQELLRFDTIRPPRPLEDGTEVMGSPNPGYWGRIAIIIGRAQDGSCFPLFGDAVVLGRERGDILFAEDGYVSGTHARISYRHGQVYLQDLASSNGTFLKVRGERTVRTGAFVLMGQQLFRLVTG